MRQALTAFVVGMSALAPAWAGDALEVIHDSGRSVPLAPYVAQIVGDADDASVMDGLRFPYRTQLRAGVLRQDGLPVFNSKWLTQPVFVLAADDLSMRWLAFNHDKLVQLKAVGIVVQAGSPAAFKMLQRLAKPLHLAPETGKYLTEQLARAGAGVYPVLVHSNGRAYQILPQGVFGADQ